MLNRTIMQST